MSSEFGETPLGLASKIMNLAGILTRRAILRVPRYQRPYTWTEREVRRLLQDLRGAFLRQATFYFIGQIVLVKNDMGELEISDGQQRLATLTMILAYARDRMPDRAAQYQHLIMTPEGGGRPRMILRDEGSSFYRGYVQEPGHMDAMTRLDDIGQDARDLMCAAARTIAAELQSTTDKELDSFMGFVCRCATFNVVDADERGCAATVYNTVNDRGLALSAADNLKCDLLENARLSPEDADAAARKWEELEDRLGRANFSELLNMMPFLLTGEELVSPGDLGAFRERVEAAGGVRTFLFDKLPRHAEALNDIYNLAVDVGAASADVNRRIKMMKQLDEWAWAPAALTFLAEHRGPPERARRFFQALERFAFACEFSVIDNRVRQRRFADAARFVNDDKQVFSERVLDLTDTERLKFIERLNRSAKRDRSRRLLMIRLEAAMPGGSHLSIHDDVTVEHVLPRGGGDWWNERVPDRMLREDYANLIGNLILVTDKQNQLADNKPYPLKRQAFFNTAGAPIHALTKDIAPIEDWTLEAIDARQERLVRILCMDWDLVRSINASPVL